MVDPLLGKSLSAANRAREEGCSGGGREIGARVRIGAVYAVPESVQLAQAEHYNSVS